MASLAKRSVVLDYHTAPHTATAHAAAEYHTAPRASAARAAVRS